MLNMSLVSLLRDKKVKGRKVEYAISIGMDCSIGKDILRDFYGIRPSPADPDFSASLRYHAWRSISNNIGRMAYFCSYMS